MKKIIKGKVYDTDAELRDRLSDLVFTAIRDGKALTGPDADGYPEYIYFSVLGSIIIKYYGLDRFNTYVDEILEKTEESET